ncbi:MAG TPA: LPS assembly protein LptD [Thermoanaerobaculia bacterium]|nr:LPS assembly protein LptD [Thermoanaerobaculia bacterium]
MRRIVCLLTLVLSAVPVAAQFPTQQQQPRPKFQFMPGPKPGGGEVKVTLDRGGVAEAQKDEYSIFTGGVTIEYQDIKLRADKLTHNLKTADVVAEGNVIIDQGPTRVTATQAVYNLNSKTGTFFNATGTMDPSMYFSGERIEKVDDDTYKLTNGVFTSCELDNPAWSFHVGEAEVTMDDYARMKNISFRANGVPVFWTPRLIWPTKRDRSQGLLIPRLRFTDQFGARLQNGYFIPFGDSVDATLYADVSSSNYYGAGVDLRYVPSENVKIGDLRAYTVNNSEDGRIEWKYQYQHAQENLPGGFRGVVDIQDYSNLDFFREYDDDPRLHTLSNIYSSAYLTKNRPTYSLNILSDRRDYELLVFNSDTNRLESARQRFEQLPSLQLRMYPQRVGRSPFYFALESSASRLRSGGVSPENVRTVDADYFRTDLFPTISMQLRTPQWFSVKPQLSLRQTWYSASRDPLTNEVVDDESISRFYAQGQVEVVGPSFSRVFNRSMGGFSKFKHVIEPRIRYVYTTDVEDQNRIIGFDTIDTPFLPIVQDTVRYALTQRIIGKEAGPDGNAREVMSFSLEQSVSLSDPFPGRTAEHSFSPLLANLRVNPYQSITIDANAIFGNVSHQVDQVSFSANLVGTGDRADKYLGLTYFTTFEQPGGNGGGASQIRINTGSSLIRDRVRADVQLNFDANEGKFLEQRYLTGWTGSCYGVALEYRRYLVFGGTEENFSSYGIAVTLKNVGTIGSH